MMIDDDDSGPNNPKLTKQQKVLLNVVKQETFKPMDERKKRVAVKSGHGTGKTTLARLANSPKSSEPLVPHSFSAMTTKLGKLMRAIS